MRAGPAGRPSACVLSLKEGPITSAFAWSLSGSDSRTNVLRTDMVSGEGASAMPNGKRIWAILFVFVIFAAVCSTKLRAIGEAAGWIMPRSSTGAGMLREGTGMSCWIPPKNGAPSCCARTVHLFPGPELSNRVVETLALSKALHPPLPSFVVSLFAQVLLHPELNDLLHQIEWDRLIERESDRPL